MRTQVRVAVAVGGGVGSIGRVAVDRLLAGPLDAAAWSGAAALPWATLLVNVTGTVALALLGHRVASPLVRAGLLTGAVGAWTTVSAVGVEVAEAAVLGTPLVGVGYLVVTVAAGVLAAWAAPADGPSDGPGGGPGPGDVAVPT